MRRASASRLRLREPCRSSPPPARRAWAEQSRKPSPARLGRSLLELGGNNGDDPRAQRRPRTGDPRDRLRRRRHCGQRCTTLRRLIVHNRIKHDSRRAADDDLFATEDRRSAQRRRARRPADRRAGVRRDAARAAECRDAHGGASTAASASPTASPQAASTSAPRSSRSTRTPPIVQEETFAPILYVMRLRHARRGDRDSQRRPAGTVSSAIFTTDVREAETIPLARRQRLRHRQRQHRHQRRRDRRRVRRRKRNRRRPRIRLRRLEEPTCAARPTRSTIRTTCRWRRGSISAFEISGATAWYSKPW